MSCKLKVKHDAGHNVAIPWAQFVSAFETNDRVSVRHFCYHISAVPCFRSVSGDVFLFF